MPKFPEPPNPDQLALISPVWTIVPAGHELWRIYLRAGRFPAGWNTFRAYGPSDARFDHHELPARVQDRGIFHASDDIRACVAEMFQDSRQVDTTYGDPWLVGFRLFAPVRLLDLTGAWPTRAGASMAISSGPRPRARRWSRAIYQAYPEAQGLRYASSMYRNTPCVALYERAERALPPRPFFHRALADPLLLPALADAVHDLNYTLSVGR